MISGDLAVGGTYREHAVQGVCGDARGALFSWRRFFFCFSRFLVVEERVVLVKRRARWRLFA